MEGGIILEDGLKRCDRVEFSCQCNCSLARIEHGIGLCDVVRKGRVRECRSKSSADD